MKLGLDLPLDPEVQQLPYFFSVHRPARWRAYKVSWRKFEIQILPTIPVSLANLNPIPPPRPSTSSFDHEHRLFLTHPATRIRKHMLPFC